MIAAERSSGSRLVTAPTTRIYQFTISNFTFSIHPSSPVAAPRLAERVG
ncbi:hypothetical protein RISK_000300 [Rhodopirellula islandica]|uniref:Uncharacterized protein n=1 Tax=Rhodopirellula islandica TaxID=595434 RepID=A0A0J1BME4_RHOIS|nr:hypothetical protein RISK_000300 [Rhodopirellula islandica]